MDPKKHIHVGWIYFIAAWLSLFLIDGIISFMLTPGRWLENGNFWSAFFNPSFPPSLIFRTAFALILAGVFGLITSTRIKDEVLSKEVTRYCVMWLILPFALLIPSAFWYIYAISAQAREMILGGSPETVYFAKYFLGISPLVILGGLIMILRLSRPLQRALTFLVLIVAFLYMGAFEMVRKSARRPYIIYGHMYSNGILKSSLPRVREQGVLATARWVTHRDAAASNRSEAGRELFRVLCISCHSVGGPRNDILVRARDMDLDDIRAVMSEMGDEKAFMPPFAGTEEEKETLASYITIKLMKRE
jgi:mono/diheme cytochrome c family protein